MATLTTLPFGAESPLSVQPDLEMVQQCEKPLQEYLFGPTYVDPTTIDDSREVYLQKLEQWIRVKGPEIPAHLAPGHVESIAGIWNMLRTKDTMMEDLSKLEDIHEKLNIHVTKAKDIHMKKMTSQGHTLNPEKVRQLEEWGNQKIKESRSKVAQQEQQLQDLFDRLKESLNILFGKLRTDEDPVDQECDALVLELGQLFDQAMEIDPKKPTPTTSEVTPEINATTVALQHVEQLTDGPEKQALMAVLEAATTSKVGISTI